MPIYEYEPVDRECLMCPNRIEVIQGISDPPLIYCPHCGLEVRRVVSRVQFKVAVSTDADAAARRGFTTFRRAEKGTWERVAGEGPAKIVHDTKGRDPEDDKPDDDGELRIR